MQAIEAKGRLPISNSATALHRQDRRYVRRQRQRSDRFLEPTFRVARTIDESQTRLCNRSQRKAKEPKKTLTK